MRPLCLMLGLSVSIASSYVWTAKADTTFSTVEIQSSGVIEASVSSPRAASAEQRALYREKIERLRRHHILLPTRESAIPFSTRISSNKQVVKPRNEASFSDGIDVLKKIDATSKKYANMDYDYVSPVAEPSSAVVRNNIIVTFNWGAIWSSDGGKTFTQLDPFALFENPKPQSGIGFCCDQVVLYAKSHDLLVWLLQGSYDNNGSNTVRLLVAKGADIEARKWTVHDFSPTTIGGWTSEWFDYPDMALTKKHLFVSMNSFGLNGSYRRSAVLRFSLDQLAAGDAVQIGAFLSDGDDDFSPRFSQGGMSRMFWAAHSSTSRMVIRSWADEIAQPDHRRIAEVERWSRPTQETVVSAPGPNRRPWLSRLDGRVTAGWATQSDVGFAWSSGNIQGSGAIYPHPHVRVAIFDREDLEKKTSDIVQPKYEPHIWHSRFAFAYPAAAPNNAGALGLAMYFGGPKDFPSSAVGVFRKEGSDWRSTLTVLSQGRNTPRCITRGGVDLSCGTWGDYLNVRPHPSDNNAWYVAAHTAEESKNPREKPKVVVTFSPFHLKTSRTSPPKVAQGSR